MGLRVDDRPTVAQVRVYASVASCAGQLFAFLQRDVLLRVGEHVFFSESEVDEVDFVAVFAAAYDEVVRLDVAVDELAEVQFFDALDLGVRIRERGLAIWSASWMTVFRLNLCL